VKLKIHTQSKKYLYNHIKN